MVDGNNHPVWNLYDEFRTARLNVKCIQDELRYWTRISDIFEIVIAFGSTTSIGGFWFFQSWIGGYLWKTLGTAAVIFTIVRRVYKVPDRVRLREDLLFRYKILEHDFQSLVIEVNQRQAYDRYCKMEFKKLMKKKSEMENHSKGFHPSDRLIDKCEKEVEKELPGSSFFIPD